MTKIISIEGMSCGHCVKHVETALKGLSSVKSVKVDLKKNQAEVALSSEDDQAIRDAVSDAGYTVTKIE